MQLRSNSHDESSDVNIIPNYIFSVFVNATELIVELPHLTDYIHT